MVDVFKTEVIELHQFFESWMKGTIAKTANDFNRFSQRLDEDFIIIRANGCQHNKKALNVSLRQSYQTKPDSFSIRIRNFVPRFRCQNAALVSYEEWQTDPNETGRISTALFKIEAGSGELKWHHVHETWIGGR